MAEAITIYVDAREGDDARDGASPENAVRTLSEAQDRIHEAPEDASVTLRLARGSVWREAYDYETRGRKGWPPFAFAGRDGLRIEAYGEGDKPTLSGLDLLPNAEFFQEDPETYPNVWAIRITPPDTHNLEFHDRQGIHPGVFADGNTPLYRVYPPLAEEERMRDDAPSQDGVETEEDALQILNKNPGTYYVRNEGDGAFVYFLNSGTNPKTDGRTYEYRVRGSFFLATPGSSWEGIRILGSNHRDGVGGAPDSLKDVEFANGFTHNMLISTGHFQDVVSRGAKPEPPEGMDYNWKHGNTYSLFHTHGRNSPGVIYDRCLAKNADIAFFDHHADANRPAVVIRDSETRNVRSILGHGNSTNSSYLIGHRHENTKNDKFAGIGGLTAGKNFIEDSVFLFDGTGRGQWHKGYGGHLHMRNSVILARYDSASPRVIFLPTKGDWLYENVTLILDLRGRESNGQLAYTRPPEEESDKTKWIIRDSVIAVIGGDDIKKSIGDDGIAMTLSRMEGVDLTLENVVLTYIEDIPAAAGTEGRDYFFATAEEIFAGNPAEGDFTLRADGPAAQRNAGYREGMEPVFRPIADQVAKEMPFYQGAASP